MDTLTHALSGLLLARATQTKQDTLSPTVRGITGFLVAASPDLDFITRFFGISAYLQYHRGITHSILMLPLWALCLSWLLAKLFSLRGQRKYAWQAFYLLTAMSLGLHIFADVITAYGTEVLAPVWDYRLALPTTFIIDPYFTGIILLGIVLSFVIRDHRQKVAMGAMAILLSYILFQNYWSQRAIENSMVNLPVANLSVESIHAIPQPLSPFNWKVIVTTPERYYIRDVNIYRRQTVTATQSASMFAQINALYTPAEIYNWYIVPKFGLGPVQSLARDIWQDARMQPVRKFMLYPAVYRFEKIDEGVCVWFADQRFVLRDIRAPFVFGACRHDETGEMIFLRLQDGKPARFD